MKKVILLLTTILLLASCSAGRHTAADGTASTLGSATPQAEAITARIGMSIYDSDLSCTGKLRMLRDDVVQINLIFLGMNIGTLEFMPDTVLLIDRINKQYVRARYADIDMLRERQIAFPELQGLFWGASMNGREDEELSWTYPAFGKVNKRKIPSAHQVRFKSGNLTAGFDMELTELSGDRNWTTRTQFDESEYTRRNANALFKALLNMQ